MSTNHTPGPWRLFIASDALPHAVLLRPGLGSIEIGHYGYDPKLAGEDFESEQLANARLIAAAPDLLEAAKLAVRFIEGMHTEDKDAIHAYKALLSVVAKAEGKP